MARIEGALVALRLPSGNDLVKALDDAWSRGDAVLPVPVDLPPRQLRRWLTVLRPDRIVEPSGTTTLRGAEPVPPGTALVVATSGSTGEPKGVVLSHRALAASANAALVRVGARRGDRWLCCLPLHHVAGLQVVVRARQLGTEPIIHERFDVAAVARAPRGVFVSLVPTMLRRLLDAGVDAPRFAGILLGGAPAAPALLERARAAGAHVVTTYGMTETCGGCVYDGVPLDGVDVRLDERGRIHIRGPVLFDGYRDANGRLRASLEDGWFDTADLGAWDDGRLAVVGRADDIIVTGGENVAPAEVEAVLSEHPGIAEAAVLGRADPEWGQRVVAYITVNDAASVPDLTELRRFVAERAGRHTAPRDVVVVDALPRTDLGKVDPRRLLDAAGHRRLMA